MKITDIHLTKLESKGIMLVQSDFPEIVYGIDRRNGVLWEINRKTGQQRNIAAENIHAYAYELMDVADLYLPQRNLWRAG